MNLLEKWRYEAYENEDERHQEKLWDEYFHIEKEIYTELLANPDETIEGTLVELAERYNSSIFYFTGFLDGINDSLKTSLDLENLVEDSKVEITIDTEKLYYNMLEAKADWLYGLPEWDSILTEEKRKEIEKEQRLSGTFIREERKIGRNEPCPCGSGKKYKKCCGAN